MLSIVSLIRCPSMCFLFLSCSIGLWLMLIADMLSQCSIIASSWTSRSSFNNSFNHNNFHIPWAIALNSDLSLDLATIICSYFSDGNNIIDVDDENNDFLFLICFENIIWLPWLRIYWRQQIALIKFSNQAPSDWFSPYTEFFSSYALFVSSNPGGISIYIFPFRPPYRSRCQSRLATRERTLIEFIFAIGAKFSL